MTRLQAGIYAITHFLVDLGCALLLLGRICPNRDPAAAILLYNLLAFAAQMPMGLLADRLGRCHLFAAGGCLLVLAGWILAPELAAAAAAGLGNAAFHIGGGLHTLNANGSRAGAMGLFVSPGAFGVYLGSRFAFSNSSFPICLALATAAVSLILLGKIPGKVSLAGGAFQATRRENPDRREYGIFDSSWKFWSIAGCLFAVVILRSLLGLAMDVPWKADWGFWTVCAVAGGKAAGGYLADRFGVRTVAMVSLSVSALCFLGSSHPAAGLAALFLFNMTMPLTLWAMARIFPEMKGFSFGLLTFGLFLGFLPVYFGRGNFGPIALALGTGLSLLLLAWSLRQVERRTVDAS